MLGSLADGRLHRAELRFDPDHGPVTSFCVGYQVWFAGSYTEIVRFDSDHGKFHRHEQVYPASERGEIVEWFADIPVNQCGSLAVKLIRANAEEWIKVLPLGNEQSVELGWEQDHE